MDGDPGLDLELDVCAAYGIAHSAFLSWPASDRDKAIWHHIRRRRACPECGTRPEEWDPAHGGRLDAYVAKPERCRGCAQTHAMSDTPAVRDVPGTYVVLVRNQEVSTRAKS